MKNPVDDAIAIWKAGVAAVEPSELTARATKNLLRYKQFAFPIYNHKKITVVGAGKAGGAMSRGIERAFQNQPNYNILGHVNVPKGTQDECQYIHLHPSRPQGSNFPTQDGVDGCNAILKLLAQSGKNDVIFGLISGGGSALLPAPVDGVSLADLLQMTRLLHASGATIGEMNCVRKHLSRIQGGWMAHGIRCNYFQTFVISDVVGDPLNVISSGPTVPDPTTFADAIDVLQRYKLTAPASIRQYLELGNTGLRPETPKSLPDNVTTTIIGSNATARTASLSAARYLGFPTTDLTIEGDVIPAATNMAALLKGSERPSAKIFGGETTVTLGPNPGKGGRNQEFVLAMLYELGEAGMHGVTILSGGTDGEDGPTDAAGAIGTLETLQRAKSLGLNPREYLDRHDAYHFFEATGGLFKTGLTGTNVMDLGVILLR